MTRFFVIEFFRREQRTRGGHSYFRDVYHVWSFEDEDEARGFFQERLEKYRELDIQDSLLCLAKVIESNLDEVGSGSA